MKIYVIKIKVIKIEVIKIKVIKIEVINISSKGDTKVEINRQICRTLEVPVIS